MSNSPFPFMPMSFVVPNQQQGAPNDIPARVRVALEYLHSLTLKTMERGMVNNMGFDSIKGQELSVEEVESQVAACKMLTAYFYGNLRPDSWEGVELEARKQEAEETQPLPAPVLTCPQCMRCGGPKQLGCRVCRGTGQVVVMPFGDEG